jgi:hypothetical protein
MNRSSDEEVVVALVAAVCLIAVVGYLGAVVRSPSPTPAATAAALPAETQSPTARRPAVPAPEVRLNVTVWPHGPGKGRLSWQVTCPPMTAACRAALGRPGQLAGEARGPCPRAGRANQAEALVEGSVAGRAVETWLDRRDGCGAARWQALKPVLTPPATR